MKHDELISAVKKSADEAADKLDRKMDEKLAQIAKGRYSAGIVVAWTAGWFVLGAIIGRLSG